MIHLLLRKQYHPIQVGLRSLKITHVGNIMSVNKVELNPVTIYRRFHKIPKSDLASPYLPLRPSA